jgi:tetratricopeptide (TPR) repeat protein
MRTFVGRQAELAQLGEWLRESPVVAITGPSGIGKSSLATWLAYALMSQFDEGVIWVSAFGGDEFRIYDIVRAIEDVLATGITSQSSDQWEILALQQLYGRRRLIVLDEITQASQDTAHDLAEAIGRLGPGGPGRVILVGRQLPEPLAELVAAHHLELGGLKEEDVAALMTQSSQASPADEDLRQITALSKGHPLAVELLTPIWQPTLVPHAAEDWKSRFETIVDRALDDLNASHPAAAQLLNRFTLSSGGGDFDAMRAIYWPDLGTAAEIKPALDELIRRGLLQYDPDGDRYLLHPALRRLLMAKRLTAFASGKQRELAHRHAQYYLAVGRQYERIPPHKWTQVEGDWANIRQGMEWATQQLEALADASIQTLLSRIDSLGYLDARQDADLPLVRDYALALRTYCVRRQPPLGFRWLAAGLVAAQVLGDSWSRTLIGGRLCTLAYFRGDYDLAETWLRNSLNAFVSIDDRPRLSRVWADLGALYKAQGRFEEALAACQQTYSINEGLENWQGAGSALTRIGSVYFASQDLEKALASHQRSLALFREHDDLRGQAIAQNNIGLVYEARGDFRQAVNHYQESAHLHESLYNTQGMITSYGNLGSVSYELGDFQAAIEWYQKDLALSQESDDWTGVAATLHNMGHVALEMEDLEAARDYFVRSRDLYARFGLHEFVAEEEILIKIVQDRRVVRG